MRIVCVGGGPAGLYFSILMKLADPRHEVTVLERNRPDDTFGFGVVFSDATLDNLREADPETHRDIMYVSMSERVTIPCSDPSERTRTAGFDLESSFATLSTG